VIQTGAARPCQKIKERLLAGKGVEPRVCTHMSSELEADFAGPRNACAFTGYSGSPSDGTGGPIGTLLLCVNNTAIPCKVDGIESQRSIQFTVVNVRKVGWGYAPW